MPEMLGGRRPVAALALTGLVMAMGCTGDAAEGAQVEALSAVGDCLAPHPGGDGRLTPAACDAPEATVEIVEIAAAPVDGFRRCPAGTDVVADGRQGLLLDDALLGVPRAWCLRNLSPPHPGDPGHGGGELIRGDCFSLAEDRGIDEVTCGTEGAATSGTTTTATTPMTAGAMTSATTPGTGNGGPAPQDSAGVNRYWLLGIEAEAVECPPGTTEPIRLDEAPEPNVLCATTA